MVVVIVAVMKTDIDIMGILNLIQILFYMSKTVPYQPTKLVLLEEIYVSIVDMLLILLIIF